MRNTSNIFYGAHIIMERPRDIPVYGSTGWVLLAQYAAERMKQCRGLTCDPRGLRTALCRFWGDLSAQAVSLGLEQDVVQSLGQLNDEEYLAAGYWLDGRWHADGLSMASLLWWMQVSQGVVSAAYDLHVRAVRDHSSHDGRIRTGLTMALVVRLVAS